MRAITYLIRPIRREPHNSAEPDAGSDLQSVMLKATQKEDGTWVLNGVKRFITNGDSDIHLVLARSEEGTKDGRGLSMFIYDGAAHFTDDFEYLVIVVHGIGEIAWSVIVGLGLPLGTSGLRGNTL